MKPMTAMDCLRRQAFSIKNQLLRRKTTAVASESMISQYASKEEILAINWRKRQNLVEHAFHSSPFYRRKLVGCGFQIGDLKHESDWEKLPILSREDLTSSFQEIAVPNVAEKLKRKVSTGGSTGTPVSV